MYLQPLNNMLYTSSYAKLRAEVLESRAKASKAMSEKGELAFYYSGMDSALKQCCCVKCGFYSPELKYQILVVKDQHLTIESKNIEVQCQLCYFADNIEWALRGQLVDIIYFPELNQIEINKLVRRIYCNQYTQTKHQEGEIGVLEWNQIVKSRGDELFMSVPKIGQHLNTNDGWLSFFKALEPHEKEKFQVSAQKKNLRIIAKASAFSKDELNHFNSTEITVNR